MINRAVPVSWQRGICSSAEALAGYIPDAELNNENIIPSALDKNVAAVIAKGHFEVLANLIQNIFANLGFFLCLTFLQGRLRSENATPGRRLAGRDGFCGGNC